MLINLSNHPYAQWSDRQKAAAAAFGECRDIPFPQIPTGWGPGEVDVLASEYSRRIIEYGADVTVHIMGEQTFCFALISLLLARGIRCVASCTERDVTEMPDGSRQVRFHFARFRPYSMPT